MKKSIRDKKEKKVKTKNEDANAKGKVRNCPSDFTSDLYS